jgi:protein-S-isoprenylcysteine O-methyltransferase Ste14
MPDVRRVLKPSVWVFYAVLVLEILFMISPAALYFYGVYGPVLNLFHRWAATAWLTQFFLPHFSETRSAMLNVLPWLAGPLMLAGIVVFFAGAIPVYWTKLRGGGAVTTGVYAWIRHPQYVGLALLGLGTLLLWPRFLVLVSYVTMLCLYARLARWEEERCLARFGESYRTYQSRTGRFLPRGWLPRTPRILPPSGPRRSAAVVAIFLFVVAVSVWLGFGVRGYALSQVTAFYTPVAAVLSPALLTEEELRTAYRTAATDARVETALRRAAPGTLIIYVVPLEWRLPDLPLERDPSPGPHHQPTGFDRRHYKVLFTQARTHVPHAAGREIVLRAYGRDPIVVARVDISGPAVTAVETPPAHVRWGDIPTPMF